MPADSTLRNLAKSAFTFPLAMSLLAVQQAAKFAAASSGGLTATADALDEITRATREQPSSDWRERSWQATGIARRAVRWLRRLRPPSIDRSLAMRVGAEPRLAPLVTAAAGLAAPTLAWLDSFRIAGEDAPGTLLREARNKLRVIQAVADTRSRLGLDDGGMGIRAAVDRAADLEPFDRFWSMEAIGAWYGERALARARGRDPDAVLTAANLPPWCLPMLHAGIGIAFARDALAGLEPMSAPPIVREAIARFVRLCRRSSRPGYTGAAVEGLGFAARAFQANLVDLLDAEIPQVDPTLVGYFWHGVGRAIYFVPENLLPSSNAPRGMFTDLDERAPCELALLNALSGIAWSATLTNLEHPEVVDTLLQDQGAMAARGAALSDGIASALAIRLLTTPGDLAPGEFIDYDRRAGSAAGAACRSLVAVRCRAALQGASGERRSAGEELFRYRPSAA